MEVGNNESTLNSVNYACEIPTLQVEIQLENLEVDCSAELFDESCAKAKISLS